MVQPQRFVQWGEENKHLVCIFFCRFQLDSRSVLNNQGRKLNFEFFIALQCGINLKIENKRNF